MHLVGDSLNAILRHDLRTLIGLPIGGALIAYFAVVVVPNASTFPSFIICIATAGVLAVMSVAALRFDLSHASCTA